MQTLRKLPTMSPKMNAIHSIPAPVAWGLTGGAFSPTTLWPSAVRALRLSFLKQVLLLGIDDHRRQGVGQAGRHRVGHAPMGCIIS
jgi:hypothetical protein